MDEAAAPGARAPGGSAQPSRDSATWLASKAGPEVLRRLADWLDERIPLAGLRAAGTLSRPGYDWGDFIADAPPADPAEADQFCLRAGVLLAVLYAASLRGGNLRPGAHTVFADITALPHRGPTTSQGDPAADFLAASVYRTCLLPTADAGDQPAGPPPLSQAREAADHESAWLAGFRIGYAAVTDNRDEVALLAGLPSPDGTLASSPRLTDVDRRDQEWIISASLAATRPRGGHQRSEPMPVPLVAAAAEPARLLTVACGLADQIVSRGMAGRPDPHPGRVNWLGLRLDREAQWQLGPMDATLADGYTGVALFLSQLAALSGVGRYADVARKAVIAIPLLLASLTGKPESAKVVGCGGYYGLGGISYGLARMSALLGDTRYGEWAAVAADLASTADDPAVSPSWAEGTAGYIAAMAAVRDEMVASPSERLARVSADRLADMVERTDGRCASEGEPSARGFAYGPAGVGWALARFATVSGETAYLRAGRHAVRRAGDPIATADCRDGWCRGTAGLLVARSCLADEGGVAKPRPERLLLGARPILRDLSLCHGELGIAEAVSVLFPAGQDGPPPLLRRRAGLLLDAVQRYPRICGTPSGVSTPGLLNGLAGIGYGLLRLAFPGSVPPVLLLEPTPARSPRGRPKADD